MTKFIAAAILVAIGLAQVSTSARHAVDMGLYPEGSTMITLSKENQTWMARNLARQMADRGYQPPIAPRNIPVPGEVFRDFVKWLYQRNMLVKNQMRVGRRIVNLKRITCPVLNLVAAQDDLVPPAQSEPFNALAAGRSSGSTRFGVAAVEAGSNGAANVASTGSST